MLKKILLTLLSLFLLIVGFGYWFLSMANDGINISTLELTQPKDLAYLDHGVTKRRGTVLAVVTSTAVMGDSGKKTGFELTELARAYYVFQANGFDVDIASPKGGKPPMVIDDDDMGEYDYAFLNDQDAQQKVSQSLALSAIDVDKYEAIYFVGGKGTMWDFPDNTDIHRIVKQLHASQKTLGAVCHGPVAFANVMLDNGQPLIANKQISGFTNEEELFLIPDALEIFPFLLESRLIQQGAVFNPGSMYLANAVQDGNLITGQNPWSVWQVAETMIKHMGHTPVARVITGEENSISLLQQYDNHGLDVAKVFAEQVFAEQVFAEQVFAEKALTAQVSAQHFSKELIAVHALIAGMQFKISKMVGLLDLLHYIQ